MEIKLSFGYQTWSHCYWLYWIIVTFICTATCQKNGDLRLRNGSSPHEGIVEEYSAEFNEWINFCVDGFDVHDARVVCRHLGFPDAAYGLDTDRLFGSDTRSYYAVSLECDGTESRLVDCSYQDLSDCSVGFGASVICQKPDYVGCFSKPNTTILHQNPFSSDSMTVDACLRNCQDGGFQFAWTFDSLHCGCGNQNDIDAMSMSEAVCSCSCGGARYQTCGGPGCSVGSNDMISVYKTNKGFCLDPGRPSNSDRTGSWFRYGSEVKYHCREGYRLQGSAALQCIQKGGQVTWSHSTPSCQGDVQNNRREVCHEITTKKVAVEETTVSTVNTDNSSSKSTDGVTTPPTRDVTNVSTISGRVIGIIAAVPTTVLIVTSAIVIAVVRKQRNRSTKPTEAPITYDLQLTETPEVPPCPKPRRLIPGSGSFTLPIRKYSSNSSDYYASIDLYTSDAEYENIARKKINVQSGKEVFVPLYGSRFVHATKSGITRTLQTPVHPANLLHYHSQHRITQSLRRDIYEDTTLMVDNDLYASRDEFPTEPSQVPVPPVRTKHLFKGSATRIVEGAEKSVFEEREFLPEEAAQG